MESLRQSNTAQLATNMIVALLSGLAKRSEIAKNGQTRDARWSLPEKNKPPPFL